MSCGSEISEEGLSKKAPCFTPVEKAILFELVHINRDILENKKTDDKWKIKKQSTWLKLEKAFCSQPGTSKRTWKQLKKCWENSKRTTKKDIMCSTISTNKKAEKMSKRAQSAVMPPNNLPLKVANALSVSSSHQSKSETTKRNECKRDSIHEINLKTELTEVKTGSRQNCKAFSTSIIDSEQMLEKNQITNPKLTGAQSSLLEMEYEAHEKKMEYLNLQLENEKMKMTLFEKEHAKKMEILQAKVKYWSNSSHGPPIETVPKVKRAGIGG